MSNQSRRDFLRSFGTIFGATAVAPIAAAKIASSGEGRLLSSIKALWAKMPWVKPKPLTPEQETRLLNQALFEKLCNGDPQMGREAIDAINSFTRAKMREDGFYRRILPPVPITNEELDRGFEKYTAFRSVHPRSKVSHLPCAAITVPFGTLPSEVYIRGPRYHVCLGDVSSFVPKEND